MKETTDKLFLVYLKNFSETYRTIYVVAKNLTAAYSTAKQYLKDNDLCFIRERELEKIELVAENTKYPDCENILLFENKELNEDGM
jgi:hypothetical protein